MDSQTGERKSVTDEHTEPIARLVRRERDDWESETISSGTIEAYDEGQMEEFTIANDDEDLGGQLGSTISATESVFDYILENGRTYHRYRQGRYLLPNDEAEQDRLDIQHQLWLLTLHGQLHLAPVKDNPQHVLDIGTGTGIWAIDYATEHPSTKVIGCDLSPIQPNMIPSNCVFEVDDFEDEWAYEQKFDLIHGRTLLSCFNNAKRVFEQAFKHLAPGGWFEMQDCDFPARCADDSYTGTAFEQWNENVIAGANAMGRQLTIVKLYKQFMEEVGFVNIQEKIYQCPINPWSQDPHLKNLGLWCQVDLFELVKSLKTPMTKGLGWSEARVEVFLIQVRKDIKNRNIHAYYDAHVVCGQKPE